MLGGRSNTNLFSSPTQSASLPHTSISVEQSTTGGIDEEKERKNQRSLSLDQQRVGHGSHPLSHTYTSIIYSSQSNPGMVHFATRNECMRDRAKSIHHVNIGTIIKQNVKTMTLKLIEHGSIFLHLDIYFFLFLCFIQQENLSSPFTVYPCRV
jgi:hypothetical protein